MNTPRLRMFAGPNGSGKSTLNSIISKELLGVYINPDEIEKEIRAYDHLNFDNLILRLPKKRFYNFLRTQPYSKMLIYLKTQFILNLMKID